MVIVLPEMIEAAWCAAGAWGCGTEWGVARLSAVSAFGQTGHRADIAEWPSLTRTGHQVTD